MSHKAFISYKWEDDTHNKWVEKFATDLRTAGFDAILDQWEVRLGDSFTEYMTSRIIEADVVLFIMTTRSVAAAEAPKGEGGAVKFEIQMATSRKIAGENMRLIGIYREGHQTVAHLRDHRYADFRDDSKYEANLKSLIDDLLGKDNRPPIRVRTESDLPSQQTKTGRGLTAAQMRNQKVVTPSPVFDPRISGEWEATATLSDPYYPRKTLTISFTLNIKVEMITDDFGRATGEYIAETGSYIIKSGDWRQNRYLTLFLEEEQITLTGNYENGRLWGPIGMPVGDFRWSGEWRARKRSDHRPSTGA